MTSSLLPKYMKIDIPKEVGEAIDYPPASMDDDDDDQSEVSLDESIETEVEYDDDGATKPIEISQLKSPVTKSLFPIGKEVLYFPREGEQGTCVCVCMCVCG